MEETLPRTLGPYRLDVLLGRGGVGEVYKAWDDRLARWVAIKHLVEAGGANARARFRREARAAAQLGHPAIIQVFDVLEEDGDDWIVMELVDGPTLAELVRDGPLDVGLAIDYGRQVASGIDAAHAAGMVHRDLKTENVMVLPSGHVKILDFGLARPISSLADGDSATVTSPGRIVGTARAMSPEQAAGSKVDARSDLFALGVLLYELLTARSPFKGRTFQETLMRVSRHQQPPVHELDARVPRALSTLVEQLLNKAPRSRPEGAGAVAKALERIAAGSPLYGVGGRSAAIGLAEIKSLPAAAVEEAVVVKTLLVSELVESAQGLVPAAFDRRHERLVGDLMAAHGGLEIERTGARLLLFDRPWAAVGFALAYHEGIRQLAAESGTALAARVGIHLGEVILHRGRPADVTRADLPRAARSLAAEGGAKPTAARLTSLAGPAQTLLTRAAYEVARRAAFDQAPAGLQWRDHGRYWFQGIAEELEVFEVGVPGVSPLRAPPGSDQARAVAVDASTGPETQEPIALRSWPPPKLPAEPYPVLLPYTHPAQLGGRDQEIAELRMELRSPVPILGLSAPSGAGKSSLLLAGLLPALRAEGKPVAIVRHPQEAGVAGRLLGDLVAASVPVDDHDWRGFVDRLCEVEHLAGEAPLLVLDQFEDVLRRADAAPARAALGVLLAATVRRRPGRPAPPCRWLLAYRQEYHGEVAAWLGDVLAEARVQQLADVDGLPHDLASPDRFQAQALAPLGSPLAGADPVTEAAEGFLAAIAAPLALQAADGSPQYPWRFAAGSAERLARAFAEARVARPEAPLTPELQVVLAHLMARAGESFVVEVPEDPGDLIAEALTDHLRRALESAFPAGTAGAGTRRARALLALRELATATGQRDEGLRADELARAIGEDGERILEELATPLTRLVVPRDGPDGLRYALSHDRMAEVVVRMVEEEGRHGKLLVDAELLALRRFVALKTALHASREENATRISRRQARTIAAHAEALLWDDDRRAWWTACRERRRADLRRATGWTTAALVFLVLLSLGTWSWVRERQQRQAFVDQVVEGEPATALRAFAELTHDPQMSGDELLAFLRRREVPMDVLEQGLGGIPEEELGSVVLRIVEIALPWVAESPDDPVLIANLVWALDYGPGRGPSTATEAQALRNRVLEPLRKLRSPPPIAPDDPDWIEVPAGTFLMGSPDEEGADDEHPQHEVTVSAFRLLRHEVTSADYRILLPDHKGENELPTADVTWYQAYTWAAWLGGRLPTEAEWEYAARAGCPYAYCTRDGREATVDDVAWTSRNSRNPATGELAPSPVMRLEPNPLGLYEMLGSLWEWTSDWYARYPTGPQPARSVRAGPQHAPWGPTSGGGRVVRGGGFRSRADVARVACRGRGAPGDGSVGRGFRVLLPGRSEPLIVDH